MKVLSGRDLADFIKERQAKQVRALRQAWGIFPRLAIVSDTLDEVSGVYMRLKQRYGEDVLIDVEIVETGERPIIDVVDELNSRDDVQGVIVQLPISDMSQVDMVLGRVAPEKDVDGLAPESQFDPATPVAINWLLNGYGVELVGRKIAIVGHGRLVGAPLERMWRTSGLETRVFELGDDLDQLVSYDVVVSAAGAAHIIKSHMLKPSATVVDAGTSSEGGEVLGDVDPAARERLDISITPEKGGVGPLTVAALFDNLINACLKIANDKQST